MDNMFEHACFCKPYRTRSGDKVFYFEKHSGEYPHMLLFSSTEASYYDDSGKNEDSISLDVVSEWKPEVNEAELDRLAENLYPDLQLSYEEFESCEDLRDAYKGGFHDGATEQRKIDIEKACEWLRQCATFVHPDYRHLVPYFSDEDIEEFRKEMEE